MAVTLVDDEEDLEDENDENAKGAAPYITAEEEVELKDKVAVAAGAALGIEVGMATGQKLQTCLPSSQ